MNVVLFELIRVALCAKPSHSLTLTEREWEELYVLSESQSLVGICFAGLQRLGSDADDGYLRIGMSETQYLDWMALAAQIQQRNEEINQQCTQLQAKLSADGLRSSILKGQGIAHLYGEHLALFRQSGDIDIYVDCGREKAVKYARSIQIQVKWDYKHLHLKLFDDTEIEMHYVPEVLMNLSKNRMLQKWFKEPSVQDSIFCTSGELTAPSLEFNLFYILLHVYKHFMFEGVGLRQLMDYYFVLKNSKDECAKANAMELFKKYGMLRFVKGVMWIMKDVFGLEEEQLLCEPDEKEGQYILEEVMVGGNFGHHNERNKTNVKGKMGSVVRILRHNMHLLAHYPADALWAPWYFVWHYAWKRLCKVD